MKKESSTKSEETKTSEHGTHESPVQHEVRVEKVEKLRQQGIEPWPANIPVDATCQEIVDQFQEGEEKPYTIAGRLMTLRLHGKTAFGNIKDSSGGIQVYIRKDAVGEKKFDMLQHLIDIGDILWLKGISFKTKTGEITLKVQDFALVSKCLYPLPDKFHGLADIETRYRQRYLDLISSPESRKKFIV